MSVDALHSKVGNFVLTFQAVEAAVLELIVQVVDGDDEYISTLAAELEFTAKSRALDVIFTRFAQIHGMTEESPHPEFHKLCGRIEKLAQRRNEIVHSFYYLLTQVDGNLALERRPTRLKPSAGKRKQPAESLLPATLDVEIGKMMAILNELEAYRIKVIDAQYGAHGAQ